VGEASDVVVTCVTDSPQVDEVLFGAQGLAPGLAGGSLFIDCSTISPARAREFGARLASQGVAMVDAPVSGGSEGAKAGTLTIMVGGETGDVERARPVLGAMGRTVTHIGPLGSGQVAKAVNQVVLCGTYLGVAEGVVLAMKAGLDPEVVVGALSGGAAGSWVMQNRSKNMIEDRYPLGFKLALHRKDLAIALELSRQAGAALPVAALAATLEDGLIAAGFGDDDNSALARAVRSLSGI
jgi:3-hydroxyisobutyrate dehydrogenase